jgi:hypothetical protein
MGHPTPRAEISGSACAYKCRMAWPGSPSTPMSLRGSQIGFLALLKPRVDRCSRLPSAPIKPMVCRRRSGQVRSVKVSMTAAANRPVARGQAPSRAAPNVVPDGEVWAPDCSVVTSMLTEQLAVVGSSFEYSTCERGIIECQRWPVRGLRKRRGPAHTLGHGDIGPKSEHAPTCTQRGLVTPCVGLMGDACSAMMMCMSPS